VIDCLGAIAPFTLLDDDAVAEVFDGIYLGRGFRDESHAPRVALHVGRREFHASTASRQHLATTGTVPAQRGMPRSGELTRPARLRSYSAKAVK